MGLNSGSVYVESNTSSWKKLDEFHDHEPCVPDPLLQSFILPENKIDRFPSLGQQLYKLLEIKESFSMWKSSIPTGFFFLYTNVAAVWKRSIIKFYTMWWIFYASVRVPTHGWRLTAYCVQNDAQFWKCLRHYFGLNTPVKKWRLRKSTC